MEKGVAYFYEDIESIKRECLNYMVSKTYCINIRPFEAERFGFKLGRALKKKPAKYKTLYEYFMDEYDRVRLIEIYDDELMDSDIYFYDSEGVTNFFFDAGGDIRNIKKTIIKDGLFVRDVNYGKRGCSISEYVYNGDSLVRIRVNQKEHRNNDFSFYDVMLSYDDSGMLDKIINVFPNGYQVQRFP